MSKDEILLKEILTINKMLGGIDNKLQGHDDLFVEIRNDIKTIVSKQNEDMVRFIDEKEKAYDEFKTKTNNLEARLTPIENDWKAKKAFTQDVKKKGLDTIWDWLKIGIVFGAGYLLTLIKKL